MGLKTPARILVIEDSGTSRALMIHLLKAFGYVLLEASDGETGIRLAQKERPELILCDVSSSRLDGYGVIREIKKNEALRQIPAVALTTEAQPERILSAGFDGHMYKPIAPETFVQEIEEFLPPEQRSKVARPRQ
jgi:CheY-like chemotaxis protein